MLTIAQRGGLAGSLTTAAYVGLRTANTSPPPPWMPQALIEPLGILSIAALFISIILWFWIGFSAWRTVPSYQRVKSFFGQVEWHPLPTRRKGWPHTAAISSRVYHARTYVYFDKMEHSILRVTFAFFNSSFEDIVVESVDGYLKYDGFGVVNYPPIGWPNALKTRDPTKALNELFVDLEQSLPPIVGPKMMEFLEGGGRLSIEFHVRIMAKALIGGEHFQLQIWQGVTCKVPNDPVVDGRIVFIYVPANAEVGATQVLK
jgi:hypothetical protein